jgi:hypothetical protein
MQREQLESEALDRHLAALSSPNREMGSKEPNEHARRVGPKWPAPMDPAAFYGLAGDFARLIEPTTEADPVALLIQFLTAFGNAAGRGSYRIADGARHHLNVFAVLVGRTSHGRKGTSLSRVLDPFSGAAAKWRKEHLSSGLSSGEGLVWAVRDPIERRERIKEKGRYTDEYQMADVDPGVMDKRLLVVEPEFISVLKVCERAGNTLSAIIRQAWDSGDLNILTKNSPAKATGAHVSIIAHITQDELLRGFNTIDAANGFANRFLWACVQRSRCLPFTPQTDPIAKTAIADRLAMALRPVSAEVGLDAESREMWIAVYPELSNGRPGLLGAVLGRAEAQVLRLALTYAALDSSAAIRRPHLEAALAVWSYCERSAEYIFGDALGDPDADAILSALRTHPEGLSRTDISGLFSRNLTADRLERALTALSRHNLAYLSMEPGAGRTSQRWRAGQP